MDRAETVQMLVRLQEMNFFTQLWRGEKDIMYLLGLVYYFG